MRFEKVVRRRSVGLTSLIDVIFLLLLFFMLASSFSRYQTVPLTSGAAGGGAAVRPALLRVHDGERMDLNGRAVTSEDLAARLSELVEQDGKTVAIWSGPDAQVQHLVSALERVRGAGLATVVVTGAGRR